MAVMTRAQLQKELVPGLNAIFGTNYKRYPEQHLQIYSMETSERSFEEEVKVSEFGMAPVKNEGSSISWDNAQEVWTARWTHETIAMGFSLTQEAVEDNLYLPLASRLTKALARSMAYTKQVKAVVPLNTGFTSYTCGDGQFLFSSSHPTVSGLTNANQPAAGVDMNETAVEAAIIQIGQWKDERGLLMNAAVERVIIPINLTFVASRLFKTPNRVNTANNDINAIKTEGVIPNYVVNNFLTDTDAWFMITDVPNGMKGFTRVGMSTGTDGDFTTGNMRYKARERYSFGVADPLGIWGSAGG